MHRSLLRRLGDRLPYPAQSCLKTIGHAKRSGSTSIRDPTNCIARNSLDLNTREAEVADRESLKILFVCSMNQWRSPTAEKIYADKPLLIVRSRGTSEKARNTVRADDLKWADIVMVMEEKHKQRLMAQYPGEMRFKELHVLDILDNYKFMDAELIGEITDAVEPILTSNAG